MAGKAFSDGKRLGHAGSLSYELLGTNGDHGATNVPMGVRFFKRHSRMIFQPGDIAACYGNDWTSRGISAVTSSLIGPPHLKWGPSHVAILCERYEETLWVESTTFCSSPCEIHRQLIGGAQAHRPANRINHYVQASGRVDIYRLTPLNRLSTQESALLTDILINHFVVPRLTYDLSGAIFSGTRLNELFCSELVATVVMRINRLNHANPSRFNPARLLRTLVRTGKYKRIATLSGDNS